MINTSQLFNLKEWLTVKDAAKHLSIFFEEEVSEADILRLALDGHLRLSVNFVNHAQAKLGKFIPNKDVEYLEYPAEEILQRFPNASLHEELKGKMICYALAMQYDDERFITFDDSIISTITGVWDLCMVGNEKNDVEHKYQMLTDGSEVTLICLDGTFLERESGEICQLQERFANTTTPHVDNKISAFEKIIIDAGTITQERLLEKKQKRQNRPYNHPDNYYPAGGMPDDSILVVRTQALIDLQENLSAKELKGSNAKDLAKDLNEEHLFYAQELKIAIEAWTELYRNNPPQSPPKGGHKKHITKWLEENYPKLGQRALDRIATVINPNPKGGASPMPTIKD